MKGGLCLKNPCDQNCQSTILGGGGDLTDFRYCFTAIKNSLPRDKKNLKREIKREFRE
jgi:hypothetical protein